MSTLQVDVRLRRGAGQETFEVEAALQAEAGITVICGPSGAGKSSLLHAIVGSLPHVTGNIRLGACVLLDSETNLCLPTHRRAIGLVPQSGKLFPHLDGLHNVAFALRGGDRRERAQLWLERVGASSLARRLPSALSGGETQRVALARALACEPSALLLDEPLTALDSRAREQLGDLLQQLAEGSQIPFLLVTHDLAEGLRLGRSLILLDQGRVVGSGEPATLIARPQTVAAARAVGTENLFDARIVRHLPDDGCTVVDLGGSEVEVAALDLAPDRRAMLALRAEEVLISLDPLSRTSARNVLSGTIREIVERGSSVELRVTTPASFRVAITRASIRDLRLTEGSEVYLLIKAQAFCRLG